MDGMRRTFCVRLCAGHADCKTRQNMEQRLFSKTSVLLLASFSLLIIMAKALPQIRSDEAMTTFKLYSRTNRYTPVVLGYQKNDTLDVAQFERRKPLIFLVHGWMDDGDALWVLELKDALLNAEDCNVIIVDWRREARRIYPITVAKTAQVGRRASRLLQRLVQHYTDTVGPEVVHVVGFSLGAQIAGFFARKYRKRTKQRIWRITALDPAAPAFAGKAVCVHQGDARFVDVIHTSGGEEIIKGHYGVDRPIGDVDFYPNGGKDQPGCTTLLKKIFAKLYPCHHMRAPLLFLESIRNKICRFVSKPCEGGYRALRAGRCNFTGEPGLMGFYSYSAHGRGVQTLETNSEPAYCKNQSYSDRPEAIPFTQKMP